MPDLVHLRDLLPFPSGLPFFGLAVAALVVLQSYIKVERDKGGNWTFKFEKKPLSDSMLAQLIKKIGGWLASR